MDAAKVAELAGVRVVGLDEGRKVADSLRSVVLMASDRMEAAEKIGAVMQDPAQIAGLAAMRKADAGGWAALLASLRSVRGMSAEVRALEKLVDRAGAPVRIAGPREAMEAPEGVPDGWEVPPHWHMTKAGLWAILPGKDGAEEQVRVTMAPIWVTGRLVDVDTGAHSLELAWMAWDGSALVRSIVAASTAASSQAIVGLADQGCPVHADNARHLVRYIAAAAAHNHDLLPVRRTAARLGWMPGGCLWGETWIGEESARVTLTGDEGLTQLARGFTAGGTWEGWQALYREINHRPAALVAVWASVASLLLEPCGAAENLIVEWAGKSSQGKSTVQRLGASVWGRPSRVVRSWKGSLAGHEGYIASLRNFPPWLDDTKKAKSPEVVTELVYMHSGGQGATRGKPGAAGRGVGQRALEEWRSLLGSSGEQRCTAMGEHGGAAARALVLWGSPLESGDEAKRVSIAAETHFGQLGPRVLRWLLEPANMARVRKFLAKSEAKHAAALEAHSPVAGRLAAVVAYIETAGQVCGAVGLPEPACDVMATCYAAALEGGEQSDRPAAALIAVFEVAASQPGRLWHQGRTDGEEPHQGWIGVKAPDAWDYIALRPTWVMEQLAMRGHDREVVDHWRARGWVQVDAAGKTSIGTLTWMGRQRMIRIKREALESIGVRFDGTDE